MPAISRVCSSVNKIKIYGMTYYPHINNLLIYDFKGADGFGFDRILDIYILTMSYQQRIKGREHIEDKCYVSSYTTVRFKKKNHL